MPSVILSPETAVVASPPSARPHLDYLDGLRALAALLVLFCHTLQTPWPYIYGCTPHWEPVRPRLSVLVYRGGVAGLFSVPALCLAVAAAGRRPRHRADDAA